MRNTVTILALAALLAGCTTSSQARDAQIFGGSLFTAGIMLSVTGYGIANSADGSEQKSETAASFAYAGSVIGAAGFWTLVVSSIQRPLLVQLENQEERIRVIEELEMIEEALPAEALPTTPYAPMNRPEYQRMP